MGAARFFELLTALNRQFFQCFEAIDREAGREDGDLSLTLMRQALDGNVGCGFQPFGAAKSRLKTNHQLAANGFAQQPRSFLAVAMIGIAQMQRPFWHSVKADNHRIGGKIQSRQ